MKFATRGKFTSG